MTLPPTPLRQLWMGTNCEKCTVHWRKKILEEMLGPNRY